MIRLPGASPRYPVDLDQDLLPRVVGSAERAARRDVPSPVEPVVPEAASVVPPAVSGVLVDAEPVGAAAAGAVAGARVVGVAAASAGAARVLGGTVEATIGATVVDDAVGVTAPGAVCGWVAVHCWMTCAAGFRVQSLRSTP
ncbi:hypothetical protein [Mycobacterium sp. URHB0021]